MLVFDVVERDEPRSAVLPLPRGRLGETSWCHSHSPTRGDRMNRDTCMACPVFSLVGLRFVGGLGFIGVGLGHWHWSFGMLV